jgi:hypothetical protein
MPLSALGLRRDPHGSVKQIHYEELEDGDKERPSEAEESAISASQYQMLTGETACS